ncbi:Uncharacterised protein [uncultured archaeon]|nr:Uncharacterised protein [uncultured archaeon]
MSAGEEKENMKQHLIILGLIICLFFGTGLVTAQEAGTLSFTILPGLDAKGTIKAANMTSAELLNADGLVVTTATVATNTAKFNLSGLTIGDYFIRINGLSDDLVPTRINDATVSINQYVGAKLRLSIIGNISDPAYKIATFSKGQGEHPSVRYPDGVNVAPESYAYIILSMKESPQILEIRSLGTGSELNTYSPGEANHPDSSTWTNKSFSDWILSADNHATNYNGTDSQCNMCHIDMDTIPATLVDIKLDNGWCYRCHYGKEGFDSGFIDTTAVVTPVETMAVQQTPAPTATPKAPAFEALFAIGALLIAMLVSRRYI